MADNLYTNNIILIKKIFIREDTVNDNGLDILGKISIAGDIFPTVDQTYSLGSSNIAWKDIYIETGSLYINNKKIISDESDTINISTDTNQNLKIKTSGTGSLQLESTGTTDITTNTGNIAFKSTVQMLASKKFISSDGNDIKFGNDIILDAGKNITLSGGGLIIGNASSSLWNENGDKIYYNDYVGFGITTPLDTIHSNGAITIGNSNVNTPGSIRWTGSDFEGYTTNTWKSLTTSPNNSSINGLLANGNIEITGTLIKNGGTDLIIQIVTNKTDIVSKANKSSPTFTGTVTGNNFILTGTLTKSGVNDGADLLAQIATNKADIATEKSRVTSLLSLTDDDLIKYNTIESSYQTADIGISAVMHEQHVFHDAQILS